MTAELKCPKCGSAHLIVRMDRQYVHCGICLWDTTDMDLFNALTEQTERAERAEANRDYWRRQYGDAADRAEQYEKFGGVYANAGYKLWEQMQALTTDRDRLQKRCAELKKQASGICKICTNYGCSLTETDSPCFELGLRCDSGLGYFPTCEHWEYADRFAAKEAD